MKRLAVFASGSGSNFQAIVEAARQEKIPAEVVLLVCDQPKARVIARAQLEDIPVFASSPKAFNNKSAYEQAVLEMLRDYQVDFIALAGYMRLIGPTLLNAFPQRIVNIHPSLLPAFPGLHAVEQAWNAGVKVTGVTIHYIDAGMDTGPILAQKPVAVLESDTVRALSERIHQVEHVLYTETLAELLNKSD